MVDDVAGASMQITKPRVPAEVGVLSRRSLCRQLLFAVLGAWNIRHLSAEPSDDSRLATEISPEKTFHTFKPTSPDEISLLDPVHLQRAINSAAGGIATIRISAGKYAIPSERIAQFPVVLRSGIRIVGDGADLSQITITGTASCTLFTATNCSDIALDGLEITGNSQSTSFGAGGAILVLQDGNAMMSSANFQITNCRFKNFKAEYWIWFLNRSQTIPMSDIMLRNNQFESATGNAKGPNNISMPSYCVGVQGSSIGRDGVVRNVAIVDNLAEATHIKGFLVLWQGTYGAVVTRNRINNAGREISDNCGAYAIVAYDNSQGKGKKPDRITVNHNVILSPRSCGVYVVSGEEIVVQNNLISGQSDTIDGTIPKAAIALNGSRDALIADNVIENCHGGIVLYGATAGTVQRATRNQIRQVRGERGFGIKVATTMPILDAAYEVLENEIDASNGIGIILRFSSTNGARSLTVARNQFSKSTKRCVVDNPLDKSRQAIAIKSVENNTGCTQ